MLLAEHTQGLITALDNDEYNLTCLRETISARALQERVELLCASMTELPFAGQQFEAIWAEGSAYIMGFDKALNSWRPFIRPQGFLVVSDLVWLTDNPPEEASAFWRHNYPDMKTVGDRLSAITKQGYRILNSFPLSQQAWTNYLAPLRENIARLSPQAFSSNSLADINKELDIHQQCLGNYAYQFFCTAESKCIAIV